MKEHILLDAMSCVENDIVEKFFLVKAKNTEELKKRKRFKSMAIFAAMASLVCLIIIIPVLNSDAPFRPSLITKLPIKYPYWEDRSALLDVEIISVEGVFNKKVTFHTGEYRIDKYVILKTEVKKDFYNTYTEGEILYVALPVSGVKYGRNFNVDIDEFMDFIENTDSIVFYTNEIISKPGVLGYEEYIDVSNSKPKRFYNLCICRYTDDGMIPINNGVVDFERIDNICQKIRFDLSCSKEFTNFHTSKLSLKQGEAKEDVYKFIDDLIENKVIGG